MKTHRPARLLPNKFRLFLTYLISASLIPLTAITSLITATPSSASNATCSGSMAKQSNYIAAPSHGQVFYIDSGVTPKNDASYIGYSIGNYTGSTVSNLWVSVSNFTGGALDLANPDDKYQQIETIPNNDSATVFFLLKATMASTTAQSHTIKVFAKRPDLQGATALLTCDYSFSAVTETIKASANKITAISSSLSPSTATLGGLVTVTVTGDTGKVGAGSSPDFDVIWVSPASVSSWPTQSLRLESVTVTLACGGSNPDIVLKNILFRKNVATDCFTAANGSWTGVYVFRIIGPGPSNLSPTPVAQISSGTRIKHSDPNGKSISLNLSGVSTATYTFAKSVSTIPISSTASSITLQYTLTLTTTATSNVDVDEFIDKPNNSATFVAGSARITDVDHAVATAISDPTYIAAESSMNPRPIHFIGPFTLKSTRSAVITYQMTLPCSATPTSYANSAYAYVGKLMLGSTSSTIPTQTVTSTTSGVSSCGATAETSTTTIDVYAQTTNATGVTSSVAVLNGYANAYSVSGGASIVFRYGTNSDLSGASTVSLGTLTGTALTAESTTVTGLTSNTKYYFRIEANSIYGEILNFKTDAVQAVPTVITDAVSSLTGSTATLNGRINANLTPITQINFIWGTSSVLSGATTVTLQMDNGSGSSIDLTAGGSNELGYTTNITGLNSGTTYYYRLKGVCTVDATYCPAGYVNGSIVSFIAGAPAVTTSAATTVGSTSATLNGSVNTNSTASNGFYWYCAASASCTNTSLSDTSSTTLQSLSSSFNGSIYDTLTGLTPGTTYYYRIGATTTSSPPKTSLGLIYSFTTLNITTPSLPSGSVGTVYSNGVSGVGGSSGYTWSITAGSLQSGLTLNSSTGLITGNPTEAGSSSLTFQMLDNYFGTSTTKSLSLAVTATLTYDSNTATSGSSPTSQSSATSVTVSSANTLQKTNYTFNGWNTQANGRGDTYTVNSTYTLSGGGNVTLYALWIPITYTVTYNGNGNTGGTAPVDSSSPYNSGTPVTIKTKADLTREGYTFANWNTAANGSGTNYSGSGVATFTPDTNTVLYAKWTANTLVVTYNSHGGTSYDTTTTTTGGQVSSSPGTPTYTGHTFNGWFAASSGGSAITFPYTHGRTADFTLHAQWTTDTYTVTYNGNGNTGGSAPSAQTKTYGVDLPLETNSGSLSRTGYTFDGWNTLVNGNGTSYGVGANYTTEASLTLYAKWTPNSLTITFDSNTATSGTMSPLVTKADSSIALTSNAFDKPGYTFLYWTEVQNYVSGTTYSNRASYTGLLDITLYAQWTSGTPITITFNSNYGATTSYNQSSVANTSVTLNANNFTRAGYSLTGWSDTSGTQTVVYTDSQTVTLGFPSDKTLYAQWSANNLTVTYDSRGGSSISSGSTTTGGAISSSPGTPTYAGHSFNGWFVASSGGSAISFPYTHGQTSDFTLYAQWTSDTYTVTYNGNSNSGGSVPSDQTKTYGVDLTLATNSGSLSRSGYSFGGWNTLANGTGTTYSTGGSYTANSGITLYAKWTANDIVITFDSNTATSGSMGFLSTKADSATSLTTNGFTKSGYTFLYWTETASDTGTTYSNGGSITALADKTLYAQWTSSAVTYTVTYDTSTATSGSTTFVTQSYTTGGSTLTLNGRGTLARTGYSFGGWQNGLTTYTTGQSGVTLSSNITLEPIWNADTLNVTFDSQGGSSISATTTTTGGTLADPGSPTWSGYTFNGWFAASSGGPAISFTYTHGRTSDFTLYAQWTASVTTYTVTYDTSTATSGSTTYVTQTYTVGGSSLTLNPQGTLARTGYTFGGWQNGATTYTASQTGVTPASNITLTPIWTGVTYTVTYNGNGNSSGTVPATQTFTYGSGSVTISSNSGDLKKSGYTFDSWNTAANGTGASYSPSSSYSSAASITLYAVWDQNSKRSQSISLAGGTLPYLTTTSLNGTGYSGTGSITYSLNSGNCSLSGNSLTAQGSSGSCIVTVTIAADSTYNSASNNATFNLVKANQTINFTQPRNMLLGDPRQGLTYSATSGLPVSLSNNSSSICSVYTGGADANQNGTCSITASQGGNANYNAATNVTVTFTISSIVKRSQNLVFNQPSAMLTSDPGQKLNYFSLTTQPIIITVNTPSICEVRDGVVYPIAAGLCSITVSQNGTSEYEPASITRVFNVVRNQSVAKRQYTLRWSNPNPIWEGTPLTSIQLNAEASISGKYEYTPTFGVKLPKGTYQLLVLFTPTDIGTYTSLTATVTLLVRAGVEPLPTPSSSPNPYATATPTPSSTSRPSATPTPSNAIDPLSRGVITVATAPVTAVVTQVSSTAVISVPTPTPSTTPRPSATPTPTPTPSSTTRPSVTPTPSTSPSSVATPTPTPTPTPRATPTQAAVNRPTPGATAAPLPTPSVASATPKPSTAPANSNQGEGISTVSTNGNQVTVVAEEGYSGKTTVTVTVQEAGLEKKVVIPVTVLPLPPVDPKYQLLSLTKTIIFWGQSSNALSYQVVANGKQICATAELSCTVNNPYGQNDKMEVIALGGDKLTAKSQAQFVKDKPFLLTVVNFDTNKFALNDKAKSLLKSVASKVAALGYKDFTVYGFTDSRGGVDNQKLSYNRANAVKIYISSLVPGSDFEIGFYGPDYPVADNATTEGLAANRRAEIWVTG